MRFGGTFISIPIPQITITPKGLRWFQSGHPWIFGTDIYKKETEEPGIVSVVDPRGTFLAQALYSPFSQIALRILSRKQEPITRDWWKEKIKTAMGKRKEMSIPSNAVRLIFAEADELPSLIVDIYGDYLVCQTLSAGLEKFKSEIFAILKELHPAKGLLERNDLPVRQKERLPLIKQVVWGEVPKTTLIQEGPCEFIVDLWEGHKTGAYLDQRTNRLLAGELAYGTVCDVFSYQGWSACQMAKGKAKNILCVESSGEASRWIKENAERNGVADKISVVTREAFDFLKEKESQQIHFDTINLDPPPFAKTRREKEGAFRGYKEINLRGMKMLRPKGLLITSSCSHHFYPQEFEAMLSEASADARTDITLQKMMGAAPDHPTLPHFPEGDYLNCYFVEVVSGSPDPRNRRNR